MDAEWVVVRSEPMSRARERTGQVPIPGTRSRYRLRETIPGRRSVGKQGAGLRPGAVIKVATRHSPSGWHSFAHLAKLEGWRETPGVGNKWEDD